MTRSPLTALAAALSLGALAAAPAHAATVDVREGRSPGTNSRVPVAFLQAAPGEANDVTIVGSEATTIRITDTGAPLTAGAGCTQVDANTAECVKPANPAPGDYPWLHDVEAQLGDGDDRVRVGASRVGLRADGGAGSDVLEGSEIIGDVLDGGGGTDRLLGHDGDDLLRDGDDPAAPDADELDGGAGTDTVSYADREGGVTVTLPDSPAGGEDGEGDTLRGFENAVGGEGDDELEGTAGDNALDGRFGTDHLDGLGGGDTLLGGIGNDRLHGGAGGDRMDGGPGRDEVRGDRGDDLIDGATYRETLSCGPGDDTLGDPRSIVLVPRSCEALRRTYQRGESSLTLDPTPRSLPGGRVRFAIGCPMEEAMDGLCPIRRTGTIELRTYDRASTLLGRAKLRWSLDDRDRPVLTGDTVQLNAAGRRLAGRRAGVKTVIALEVGGVPETLWALAALKAR
ncbi:MAG TPA: calcium-binding protein [Capillimicrobium sp.]